MNTDRWWLPTLTCFTRIFNKYDSSCRVTDFMCSMNFKYTEQFSWNKMRIQPRSLHIYINNAKCSFTFRSEKTKLLHTNSLLWYLISVYSFYFNKKKQRVCKFDLSKRRRQNQRRNISVITSICTSVLQFLKTQSLSMSLKSYVSVDIAIVMSNS